MEPIKATREESSRNKLFQEKRKVQKAMRRTVKMNLGSSKLVLITAVLQSTEKETKSTNKKDRESDDENMIESQKKVKGGVMFRIARILIRTLRRKKKLQLYSVSSFGYKLSHVHVYDRNRYFFFCFQGERHERYTVSWIKCQQSKNVRVVRKKRREEKVQTSKQADTRINDREAKERRG